MEKSESIQENSTILDFFGNDQWPIELRLLVSQHLSPKDLLIYRFVCKRWLDDLKNEAFWIIKVQQYLPDYPYRYFEGSYFRMFTRGGVHLVQTLEHLKKYMTPNHPELKSPQYLHKAKIDPDLGFYYSKTNKRDYGEKGLNDMRKFIVEAMKFDCPYLAVPTKYFEDEKKLYLVFDNQFEEITDTIPFEQYNEKLVIKLVRQLIHAIQYLHERNFALISYFGDVAFNLKRNYEGEIQLQLVNYTCHIEAQLSLTPPCYFVSPERIVDPHSPPSLQSDLFSLGSLTLLLLTGLPIYDVHPMRVLIMIAHIETYQVYDPNNEYSDLAKDFIVRLLKRNPEDRMTLDEALQHEWLTDPNPSTLPLRSAYARHQERFDNSRI